MLSFVYDVCAYPCMPEEYLGSPGTGIISGDELPSVHSGIELGSSIRAAGALTTEQPLRLLAHGVFRASLWCRLHVAA